MLKAFFFYLPAGGNVINVNAQQAFLNVGGAASANTINAPSSGWYR